MRKKGIYGAAALLLALVAASARADDLPGVYATGVDDAGNVLAAGALDPHWDIVSVPEGTAFTAPDSAMVAFPHPVFIPNDAVGGPGSSWVGVTWTLRNAQPPGTYVYRTTIDLTGFDPATAQLTGRVAVDNSVVDVVVNGAAVGAVGGQFRDWTPITIGSGFVAGVNVVDLVVLNAGADPTGLRVELSGTADPLPTSIEVDVDVRPYSQDNVVNASSWGRLPVALMSTADFDATTVVPESVTLGGASVATRRCHAAGLAVAIKDVDGDDLDDLVLSFSVRDLELTTDTTELALAGETTDGTDVVGTGTVRVVECGSLRAAVRSLFGRWASRRSSDDSDTAARVKSWRWSALRRAR